MEFEEVIVEKRAETEEQVKAALEKLGRVVGIHRIHNTSGDGGDDFAGGFILLKQGVTKEMVVAEIRKVPDTRAPDCRAAGNDGLNVFGYRTSSDSANKKS